jgi:hypothetical protein
LIRTGRKRPSVPKHLRKVNAIISHDSNWQETHPSCRAFSLGIARTQCGSWIGISRSTYYLPPTQSHNPACSRGVFWWCVSDSPPFALASFDSLLLLLKQQRPHLVCLHFRSTTSLSRFDSRSTPGCIVLG